MAVLSPVAKQQFFTDAGLPAAGYKLYTYAANTTTPQATYTSAAGTSANANPIVLDSQGRATIFLDPSLTYDFVLKTSADVPVWTQEDVSSPTGEAGNFIQSGTGAVSRTMQDKVREIVSVKDFGAVGDGATDDYSAIVAAYNAVAASTSTRRLVFPPGTYYIGSNEWVVSANRINIECNGIVEIRGTGNYVVTFASAGGTSMPGSTHPVGINVSGLLVRTMTPFGASSTRAGFRVSCSYSTFINCGVITSADDDGNGLLLECDDTGSGPFYNTFINFAANGSANGLATGRGVFFGQRSGISVATRYGNTNTFIGGRSAGYSINWEIAGNGNRFLGVTSENYPAFGTAFKWVAPVSASNIYNSVYSPYVENAATAFEVQADTGHCAVYHPYYTGVTTVVSDASGRLFFMGDNGTRNVTLPSAPNPFAAHSGISLGNTNNADADTLDYYKEGTWTPAITGATSAGDYTATVTGAKYTRIGNMVHASAQITVTINSAGSGSLKIGGLPFNRAANAVLGGAIATSNVTFTAGTVGLIPRHSSIGSAESFFLVEELHSGTGMVAVPVTALAAGALLVVSVVYPCA